MSGNPNELRRSSVSQPDQQTFRSSGAEKFLYQFVSTNSKLLRSCLFIKNLDKEMNMIRQRNTMANLIVQIMLHRSKLFVEIKCQEIPMSSGGALCHNLINKHSAPPERRNFYINSFLQTVSSSGAACLSKI